MIASSLMHRGEVIDVDKGLLRSPWRLSRVRDHTISILMREIEQTLRETLDPNGRRLLLIHPPLSGLNTFDLSISGPSKVERSPPPKRTLSRRSQPFENGEVADVRHQCQSAEGAAVAGKCAASDPIALEQFRTLLYQSCVALYNCPSQLHAQPRLTDKECEALRVLLTIGLRLSSVASPAEDAVSLDPRIRVQGCEEYVKGANGW